MLERADLDYIEEQMTKIFVTRKECDSTVTDINKKLANDSTELKLIKQQLQTISWVAKTTLAAVIGFIVVYVANLIVGG